MKIEKISFCITLFATILVVILNGLYGGGHFDGADIIAILMLLLPPIKNLYSNKNKIINNKIYYYLLSLVSTYISIVSIYAFYIYINKLSIEANNDSALFFFNNLPIMFLSMLVLFVVSLLSNKKEKEHIINTKVIYLIIASLIVVELIFLDTWTIFMFPILVSISIFYLVLIFLNIERINYKELKVVYIVSAFLMGMQYVFTPILLLNALYEDLNSKKKDDLEFKM